ncbi:putative PurR-regulated permease PerM [Sinobacterium caligoides]|uniref:Putative PurR-regulated permease PerM n=1 Tax=Sinobacterium caligoides TaxID=933926 RepID=A0A3N2DLA9_9GAMM|nr:AI-2E family transporter [Sinobacterium caligoides]ROS00145.1 putative PurR-regulated permease PerM [Sinobacterium caligoides]
MGDQLRSTDPDKQFVSNMVESALKVGAIFLLLTWSYGLIKPFVIPMLWGAIIAVAAMPLVRWLEKYTKKRGLAAVLFVLLAIAAIVIPVAALLTSISAPVQSAIETFHAGDLSIPGPASWVDKIPLVGDQISQFWTLLSTNLESALLQVKPQLISITSVIVGLVTGGIVSVAMSIFSLAVAGGFMTHGETIDRGCKKIATRLVGDSGESMVELGAATIRSVLLGVVGVAIIQTVLIGIGVFAAQIPLAGLWCIVVLIFSIAQLPATIITLPLIIYAYSAMDNTTATIFTIWTLIAGLSDNVLKPMLMGRGLDIPMLVILIGAIGGMLAMGLIGLFIGAIVLAVWYKLFHAWMAQEVS